MVLGCSFQSKTARLVTSKMSSDITWLLKNFVLNLAAPLCDIFLHVWMLLLKNKKNMWCMLRSFASLSSSCSMFSHGPWSWWRCNKKILPSLWWGSNLIGRHGCFDDICPWHYWFFKFICSEHLVIITILIYNLMSPATPHGPQTPTQ